MALLIDFTGQTLIVTIDSVHDPAGLTLTAAIDINSTGLSPMMAIDTFCQLIPLGKLQQWQPMALLIDFTGPTPMVIIDSVHDPAGLTLTAVIDINSTG